MNSLEKLLAIIFGILVVLLMVAVCGSISTADRLARMELHHARLVRAAQGQLCAHQSMRSILQDWVMGLGLRHQGVLVAAVRGCDTAPKDDASKLLSRSLRAEILVCHCGDPAKAKSFIEEVSDDDLRSRMKVFAKNLDHYPHHYVMHLVHAAEIIGYKGRRGEAWRDFYFSLCKGLHVNPETEAELDKRLNADEETFAAQQQERRAHVRGSA